LACCHIAKLNSPWALFAHLEGAIKMKNLISSLILFTGIALADNGHDHSKMGGSLTPAASTTGAQDQCKKPEMCAKQGMGHCGPMNASQMVATSDGGVVVKCGKMLVKFDKNLKKVKEVEMECPCAKCDGTQMKGHSMEGMGNKGGTEMPPRHPEMGMSKDGAAKPAESAKPKAAEPAKK